MGTLAAHVLPGLFLIGIGFWHLFSSVASFVKSPREYTARAWHPMACFRGRVKHLELYLLLLLLPIAITYELVVSTNFQSLVKIGVPIYRVVDFQHAALLFGFWLFAALVLISETTLWLPLPPEASFLVAAASFGIEWMVLSGEGQGLEGKCNSLLASLAAVCAASAGLLAWKPKGFLADLVLSEGIVLQGSWLIQTGLSLYVNKFIPEGCHQLLNLPEGIDGSTQCDLEEARTRANALMDLAFICHVLVVMVLSSIMYCIVAKAHPGHRRANGYDPLSLDMESNNVQMKPMPKQAQF